MSSGKLNKQSLEKKDTKKEKQSTTTSTTVSNPGTPNGGKKSRPGNHSPHHQPSNESPSEESGNISPVYIAERSNNYESAAATEAVKIVNAYYPTSNIQVVQKKLLDDAKIRNRKLSEENIGSTVFEEGRNEFITNTLERIRTMKPPPKKLNIVSFNTSSSQYTSTTFKEVEIDICVKIPVDTSSEWDRYGKPSLKFIESRNKTPFRHSNTNTTATKISSVLNTDSTVISSPLKGSSNSISTSNLSSSSFTTPDRPTVKTNTNFTHENYPPNAVCYIIGEVFAPLSNKTADNFINKLLQIEPILCIIKVKEQKKNIRNCVLGYFFMGPKISSQLISKLYRTLEYYQSCFPNLWELQGNGGSKACRLLAHVVPYSPLHTKVYSIELTVAKQGQQLAEVKTELAEVITRLTELEEKVNTRLTEFETSMRKEFREFQNKLFELLGPILHHTK